MASAPKEEWQPKEAIECTPETSYPPGADNRAA
jgi:hypothetical protein